MSSMSFRPYPVKGCCEPLYRVLTVVLLLKWFDNAISSMSRRIDLSEPRIEPPKYLEYYITGRRQNVH